MSDSPRRQFSASVHANIPLCRDHFKLVLLVDEFPQTAPGQFIQILCRAPDELDAADEELDWDGNRPLRLSDHELSESQAMLRRPFSLAGMRDLPDAVELDIIHRVVGVGTSWLAKLNLGDPVQILGPLGNCFELPRADQTAILVGGGVGIPPLLYLAQAMPAGARARTVAFCGAVTRDLLPLMLNRQAPKETSDAMEPSFLVENFAQFGIRSVVSTDDGSVGFRGFVTQALERYLDPLSSPLAPRPSPLLIYTCGPEPMMKRVAQIALERNIECQVAVERAMACGMGTCQSCCIRVRKSHPAQPPLAGSDWCYRLACTDGPIFRAADLLW